MTFSHASNAAMLAPSFETLLETLDGKPQTSPAPMDDDASGSSLSYRSSPDGSLVMGTDPLTGQVVLIVQNADGRWEIALPPRIAKFASSETEDSLAGAKRISEVAFGAYWAHCQE